ncbi:HoxA-like transcriptional regulator/response regulator receiver protein [Halorubrum californiense DSM 19288]|uniref:HoxA-like transcriptional regulator/response regulator receiver protein n=1 Tax=Halorubrum californiense DSM 19288 TaxID=1227465 RepID=M0ELM6_9EURY|nr:MULTISPECIES: response regulator [Halorubrum]ELZ47787.1 HoxA-like transcriptional regulator/response regulator receiver protein [Halorubrum californiense DSM 19288]
MPRDTDATILIVEDSRQQAEKYADWLERYDVRVAADGESALDSLDSVDVVLLDGDLADPPAGELLGRIRARRPGCQIGLLSSVSVGDDVLRLDFDEYVPRPLDREGLRETVARLVDHRAVEDVVETFLSLVSRRRQIEARRGDEDLTDDERYRELTGEITARRQQIRSLLEQIDGSADRGDGARVDPPVEGRSEDGSNADAERRPLYRVRSREFYALWLLAALAYGVGDVVSTLYATLAVPGFVEANPVVGGAIEAGGLPGFLLLKLVVLLVLISVSVQGARQRERFSYYWPPVVATGMGLLLTGWNVRLAIGA